MLKFLIIFYDIKVLPVAFILRILGLITFVPNFNEQTKDNLIVVESFFCKCYSILFTIIFFIGYPLLAVDLFDDSLSAVNRNVSIVFFITNTFGITAIYISQLLTCKRVINYVNNSQKLHNYLLSLQNENDQIIVTNQFPNNKRIWIKLLFVLIITHIKCYYLVGSEVSYFHWIIIYYPCIVIASYESCFNINLRSLHQSYCLLNEQFTKLIVRINTKSEKTLFKRMEAFCNASDELDKLAITHAKLCKHQRKCEHLFSITILLIVTITFMNLIYEVN